MIETMVGQVRMTLDDAEKHRTESNEHLSEILEGQAYADIPPGLARVVRRKLSR